MTHVNENERPGIRDVAGTASRVLSVNVGAIRAVSWRGRVVQTGI